MLGMVKKAKYSEVLQAELQERRTTSHVKFHMKYHIHDIVGAELVERYFFFLVLYVNYECNAVGQVREWCCCCAAYRNAIFKSRHRVFAAHWYVADHA